MKHIKFLALCVVALLLASCNSGPSLQQYFVDNSENPNFLALDIPASILDLDQVELTDTEKQAINSVKKLNILAFKKTTANADDYKAQTAEVTTILKNPKYTELMKVNGALGKGTVKYLGEEDAIDEVVFYGNSPDKGFALIRFLGDNMNPAHLVPLIKAIEKSDYKGEGLGRLKEILN